MATLSEPTRIPGRFATWFVNRSSRSRGILTWLALFAGVVLLKRNSIGLPASFDESWAVLPGGLWLAENQFNIAGLLQQPQWFDLGPGTYALSPVTWLTGLVAAITTPETFMPTLHLVHMAIGAVGLREVYRFARPVWTPTAASFLVVMTVLIPVMNAQLGAVYQEIPIFTTGMLAVNAALREDWGKASFWGALGTLFKPSGIVSLVAVVAAHLLRRNRTLGIRKAATILLPALIVGVIPILLGRSVGSIVDDRDTADMLRTMVTTAGITSELLVAGVLAAAFSLLRSKRPTSPATEYRLITSYWMVGGFVAFFIITIAFVAKLAYLPRYTIVLVPFVFFAAGQNIKDRFGTVTTAVLASTLAIVMVFNQTGRFYGADGFLSEVVNESSNAHQDIIYLTDLVVSAAISENELPIYLHQNTWFRVMYPDLGFVEEVPMNVYHLGELPAPSDLPSAFIVPVTSNAAPLLAVLDDLDANPDLTQTEVTFTYGQFFGRYIIYESR